MKNFKKAIILSITIVSLIFYFFYDYLSNDLSEVEEDVFVEKSEEFLEKNTIILHITGEVISPRHY